MNNIRSVGWRPWVELFMGLLFFFFFKQHIHIWNSSLSYRTNDSGKCLRGPNECPHLMAIEVTLPVVIAVCCRLADFCWGGVAMVVILIKCIWKEQACLQCSVFLFFQRRGICFFPILYWQCTLPRHDIITRTVIPTLIFLEEPSALAASPLNH